LQKTRPLAILVIKYFDEGVLYDGFYGYLFEAPHDLR